MRTPWSLALDFLGDVPPVRVFLAEHQRSLLRLHSVPSHGSPPNLTNSLEQSAAVRRTRQTSARDEGTERGVRSKSLLSMASRRLMQRGGFRHGRRQLPRFSARYVRMKRTWILDHYVPAASSRRSSSLADRGSWSATSTTAPRG